MLRTLMIGEVLALLSAAASGLSVVLVRRNSSGSNAFNMSLIITCVGMILLWPLALISTNFAAISSTAILLFALSGVLSPGIVRLFYYKGMQQLGASVNSSMFAIYPFYSAIMATILLSEILAFENWVGIICIAAGVVFVELTIRGNNTEKTHNIKDLAFPIIGGITVAIGSILRKSALNLADTPVLGVSVAYTVSLLPYFLILAISFQTRKKMSLKRDLRLFWGAGIGQAVAWIFAFGALSFEKVSITNPLLSIEPLFVAFFGFFLLKELEQMSKKLAASIILTVIGVVLVTL